VVVVIVTITGLFGVILWLGARHLISQCNQLIELGSWWVVLFLI